MVCLARMELQLRETEINIVPKCGSRLERCQTNRVRVKAFLLLTGEKL